MLKFKNKFKFGSSEKSTSPSGKESPRTSMESRKTLSVENVTDQLSKTKIDGDNSSSTSTPKPSLQTSSSEKDDSPQGSEGASNPGLLTVKLYSSRDLQLPIRINNNKRILQTLASNSNHEATSVQLMKNLASLLDLPATVEEHLSGEVAGNFLPSIIAIPNNDLVKSLLYTTVEFDNNVLVLEPQRGTVSNATWNQVVSFDVTKQARAVLNINMFIRLPAMLIEETAPDNLFTGRRSDNADNGEEGTNSKGAKDAGDLLIGTIKLPLTLSSKPTRLLNHENVSFVNYLTDKSGIGELAMSIDSKPILKPNLSISDFDLLKVSGKGSFGKVMQVVKKDTKQIYALKTLRKQHIISRMEVTHTLAERTVLARILNPFIVPLKFSFQSPEKLYLVLSFINGGELFWHLQREGRFSMNRLRFYVAELLTALESLHEMNVIYRDLKPENILLDYQGHIALCDFGLCKLNMADNDKTNTFCGTPEYLAPELLLNQGYTRSVDWWTLGTLLYEMLTGLPPFYDEDIPTMYQNILKNPLKFPSFLEKTDAQDLLILLLQKDPANRLNDASQIRGHRFFKDIDWNKLLSKSYLPPFKPNVDNLLDTSNFDQDFTNEKPQDSVVDDFLSESVQKQFGGWTYNGDNLLN